MDLGTFYREFQNPPQLASLTLDISSQSMADDLVTLFAFPQWAIKERLPFLDFVSLRLQDSLPEKLAVYEKNIDEFDAFVDTLQ